jgi:uncharacterized membrane protein
MELVSHRLGPERAWGISVTTIAAALVVGVLAFPERVYDRFVWQYFWGPVVADAHSAACANRAGGTTRMLSDAGACATAPAPVAYPGYTLVSEVGYAVTLLLALVGVIFLLRRLGVGQRRAFFYALVPFTFFGGALRVVEDAMDAVPQGVEPAISFPWNALIISPIIYFTVFAITLAALVGTIWFARAGYADSYESPLAAVGTAILVGTLAYLAYLGATADYVSFYPQIAVVVLVASTALTGVVWAGVLRYAPALLSGTGRMGAVIVWGHVVDGVANVVGIDWATALGLPANLVPKHPVNRALIRVGEQFPAAITDVIGTAWPFLVVKIVAALAVVWVFDETIFEDSPRYAILLLVAILAVGLGPGTRDMLRATFGI